MTIFSGGGGVAEAELHELEQTVSRVEAELQRKGQWRKPCWVMATGLKQEVSMLRTKWS